MFNHPHLLFFFMSDICLGIRKYIYARILFRSDNDLMCVLSPSQPPLVTHFTQSAVFHLICVRFDYIIHVLNTGTSQRIPTPVGVGVIPCHLCIYCYTILPAKSLFTVTVK